eukprot:scaffold1326_cov75-Phaeocystis_antarctica.AAC.1
MRDRGEMHMLNGTHNTRKQAVYGVRPYGFGLLLARDAWLLGHSRPLAATAPLLVSVDLDTRSAQCGPRAAAGISTASGCSAS